ncbi:MAG: DUF2339 domain-containing protein [Verrucomicrobiota bacterium]
MNLHRNRTALALKPDHAKRVYDPSAFFFAIGAGAVFLVGGVDDLVAPWRASLLAVLAGILFIAGSERFLRYREAAWFVGPAFLGVAAYFLWNRILVGDTVLWADLGVFALLLGFEAWSRFGAIPGPVKDTKWQAIAGGLSAVFFVVAMMPWLSVTFRINDGWLYLGGIFGLALFGYGVAVRSKLLTASSLLYQVVAVGTLVLGKWIGSMEGALYWPLVFVVAQIVLIEQASRLPRIGSRLTSLRKRIATTGLLALDLLAIVATWFLALEYVDVAWQPLVLVGAGAVVLGSTRQVLDHRVLTAIAFGVIGTGTMVRLMAESPSGTVALYFGALGLLGFQQLYRFVGAPERVLPGEIGMFSSGAITERRTNLYHFVQWAAVLAGTGLLWALVSMDVADGLITVSWAILAFVLFAAGLAMKERSFRFVSLGLLAAALVRVLTIDVWKLEAVPRILSFIAIGVVLLVLGFVYNRFQATLKRYFQ